MIFLASMDAGTLPGLKRAVAKTGKAVFILYSYYDLSGLTPIPFRRDSWEIIKKEKQGDDNENRSRKVSKHPRRS